MSATQDMRAFADKLGKYIYEKFVAPKLTNAVTYYKATVTAAASGGKITVQKPFDTTAYALPYVGSAAGLSVGDTCIVFCLGSASNGVIIGDGGLTNL